MINITIPLIFIAVEIIIIIVARNMFVYEEVEPLSEDAVKDAIEAENEYRLKILQMCVNSMTAAFPSADEENQPIVQYFRSGDDLTLTSLLLAYVEAIHVQMLFDWQNHRCEITVEGLGNDAAAYDVVSSEFTWKNGMLPSLQPINAVIDAIKDYYMTLSDDDMMLAMEDAIINYEQVDAKVLAEALITLTNIYRRNRRLHFSNFGIAVLRVAFMLRELDPELYLQTIQLLGSDLQIEQSEEKEDVK